MNEKNTTITEITTLLSEHGLEEIQVSAKTILLKEGEKATKVYIVKSGCLRMWLNHNGNDITSQFFFEDTIVASMESLLTNQPSNFNLETIEDCTLYVIGRESFVPLLKENTFVKEWFNAMILDRFYYYSKHILTYLKDKPQDRYIELLKKNPHIFQRVPQHYIASYLGITSVSLSRIRNRKV
ncbi:Crp/Fnr family transcriptional regulator [Flavobacterium sp. '19STA2R22 D10 B1']|uniref:Crp/Fnr family transcriptional regulator n=1 Tax=Flavobacterium aerium TaxID=3037261 RepID=UPI00278C722E|nr:Crp/Fnr family transcriptional regulator [Flavobacterium sp. '19STA2R22 D10 B1']